MDECEIAVVELLVADEELAELVEATVSNLDDPAPVFGRTTGPGWAFLLDVEGDSPAG